MANAHRTSIRFDMTQETDARAWNYLHGIAHEEHKSLSQAIIAAICYYGEHKDEKPGRSGGITEERLEQALQKVLPDALMQAMQQMLTNAFAPTAQGMAPKSGVLAPENKPEPKVSKAAMDFMASF